MPTITVIVGSSVKQCSWYLYNGNGTLNSSGQIMSGGNKSWTMASMAPYVVLSAQPADGYEKPIYYNRTDGYVQNLDEDNTITFAQDKTGTLTATYKPPQTYMLSFGPGATDATGSMSPLTGKTTYTVPSCGFTRNGYTFTNWVYTDDDGFQQTKNVGDTITLTRNLTLYAQWTKPITVTLRSKGTTYKTYNTTTGKDLMLSAPSDTETERFEYWYETTGSGEIVQYDTVHYYKFYDDTTLYAAWTAKKKLTLTLRNRGTTYDTITLYDDQGYFLPTLYDLHDTFEYWYAIGDDGTLTTYNGGQSVDYFDFDGDTTLYAAWTGGGSTDKITITLFDHDLGEEFDLYEGECMSLPVPTDTETEKFQYWYATIDGEIVIFEDQICYEDFTGDTTLYAAWETTYYSITYNGNNATSGSSRTQSGSSTYTIYSNWFQRTGYAFQYWTYSDEYDQEHIYRPGDRVTPKRDMTLYAFWLRAYTVTYYANGGTGAPSEQTKIHNVNLTLSSTVPTRSGYDFVNWYDGTDYYSPGGTYSANSPASLYAQWRLKTYTISYNANGGTGAPSEQTKTHGVDLTLSSVVPTRSGYDFINWYDGTDYYSPGGTYRANSPASLYAQWRRKTYTVSYNANGGTGAPSAQTKTHGVDLTLSSTVPTNGNLRFMGWSTSSAASASAQYASGATYSGNDDLDLYAVWRCVAAFYNGSSLLVEKLCPIGGSVTCPTMADSGGKGLYMWQVAHSSDSYSPGASIQNLSESITLLAVWKTFYTISYNGNGGSDTVTSLPSDQRKWEDIDITLSTIRPARSGYEFFGWSTSSGAMAPRQYEAGDTYSKNESAVLYAIWRVVVICYSNGSQYGSSLYARIGGEITLPSPQPTATQVCTGWQRRDDTTIIYTPGQTLEINISFILDAIWQNGYTLTYNDGDGNSVVHTPLAITYDIWTVGQCHFTKAGSVFQHWSYTDDDGFPQTIKPLQSFTPTRSLTLYAVWKARDKFYWHGSDQADATYFAVGKRVDLAITATAWNAFLDFVNDVREDSGLARINFHKVTAGEEFSAFDFNRVRNNIDPMIPNNSSIVLPSTVSAGDEIVTSQYNGSGSLKDAINQIVDLL